MLFEDADGNVELLDDVGGNAELPEAIVEDDVVVPELELVFVWLPVTITVTEPLHDSAVSPVQLFDRAHIGNT